MKRSTSSYLESLTVGKRIGALAACVLIACALAACSGSGAESAGINLSPTARVAALGNDLKLRVVIDTNNAAASGMPCTGLGADGASCSRGRLILENTGSGRLMAGGWTLYVHSIHSIRRILMVDHPAFA